MREERLRSSSSHPLISHHQYLTLYVAVFLLIFALRVVNLTVFPPFIDEGAHVAYSEQIEQSGPLTLAHEGRQLYYYWLLALGVNDAAPLWMVRIATVLSALPGAAAAMALGRRFGGRGAGMIGGILYAFSPFHLFFDRLGLSDALSASLVLMALAYTGRGTRENFAENNGRREWRPYTGDPAGTPIMASVRRWITQPAPDWRRGLFTGPLLFAAVFAKVSALPYLGMPLAAWVSLRPRWKLARLLPLLVAALLVAAYALLLAWRGQDLFFYLRSGTTQVGATVLDNVLSNALGSLRAQIGYGGLLLTPLGVAGLLMLISRRSWFIPLVLLAPLLVLWLSARQGSRHIIVPMTLMLVLAAVALAWLWRRGSMMTTLAVTLVAITVLLGADLWRGMLSFSYASLMRFGQPEADVHEYMQSEGSGFGLPQLVERLAQENPTQVIGLLPNCQGLRMLAWDRFPVVCPRLSPSGEDIEALRAFVEEARAPGVYVALEPNAYIPRDIAGREVFDMRELIPYTPSIHYEPRPDVRILDISPPP